MPLLFVCFCLAARARRRVLPRVRLLPQGRSWSLTDIAWWLDAAAAIGPQAVNDAAWLNAARLRETISTCHMARSSPPPAACLRPPQQASSISSIRRSHPSRQSDRARCCFFSLKHNRSRRPPAQLQNRSECDSGVLSERAADDARACSSCCKSHAADGALHPHGRPERRHFAPPGTRRTAARPSIMSAVTPRPCDRCIATSVETCRNLR